MVPQARPAQFAARPLPLPTNDSVYGVFPHTDPVVLVISATDKSLLSDSMHELPVAWSIVSTPRQALAALAQLSTSIAAVIANVDATGLYRATQLVQALKQEGFSGPILFVSTQQPKALDRQMILRHGVFAIVRPESDELIEKTSQCVLAYQSRRRVDGVPRFTETPSWVRDVIRMLALYAGPSAGDIVRQKILGLSARLGGMPTPRELAVEVGQILLPWPDDMHRFIRACRSVPVERTS